jgi:hypothetical protein
VTGWIFQPGTVRAVAVNGQCHLSGTSPAVIPMRGTSVLHFGVHIVTTMTVPTNVDVVRRLEIFQNTTFRNWVCFRCKGIKYLYSIGSVRMS